MTRVVDCDLVVVAKLSENLSIVGNSVMDIAGDLNSLSLLLFDNASNVFLGLDHVLRSASYLDTSFAVTLSGHVNRNSELALHLALSITATANKRSMMLDGHFDYIRDLALALSNDVLDALDDFLHHVGASLDLDGVAICLLFRELDSTSKLTSVIRPSSSDDNILQVGS